MKSSRAGAHRVPLLLALLLPLAGGSRATIPAVGARPGLPPAPGPLQAAGDTTLESLVDALEAALAGPTQGGKRSSSSDATRAGHSAPDSHPTTSTDRFPQRGDLELTGVMSGPEGRFERRILIRRSPFAFREELAPYRAVDEAGVGDSRAPAAAGLQAPVPPETERQFFVSDGLSAWALYEEFGPGGILTGEAAVMLLDRALFFRLLLSPRAALTEGLERTPRLITAEVSASVAASGQRGPGVGLPATEEALFLSSRHGTSWILYLDRPTGRLLESVEATQTSGHAWTVQDWHALGDWTLPLTLIEPSPVGPPRVTRWHSLRTGLQHAEALFPRALPPPPGLSDVCALRSVQGPVPGAAQYMLADALLAVVPRAVRGVWVGFDTGASALYVTTSLAEALQPPAVSRESSTGAMGGGVAPICWFDVLDFGQQDFVHLPGTVLRIPGIDELPRQHPMQMVLGGRRLMERSPVLDLEAGRLLLRAPAPVSGSGAASANAASASGAGSDPTAPVASLVRPLAQIAGQPTLEVPFTEDGRGRPLLDVNIGGRPLRVLLDTGFAHPLRLTRSDLVRLGLPDDDKSWRARGALPYPITGAFGHTGVELLVQLDVDLECGPVLWERPWALITDQIIGTPGSATDPSSLVGGGILLPFAQVGFDWPGRRIELLPRDGRDPGDEPGGGAGAVRVPAPGAFLGFLLGAPEPAAAAHPQDLPRVIHVVADSIAAGAGLREGDFLAAIEGVSCAHSAPLDLWPMLRLGAQGRQRVVLSIQRDGAVRDLLLALP